ncbi:MAG: beta-glucosidase [Proteobacteria bacterium]|nr:beta-glucosidase [Pseudomonadota bacterium]
MTVIPFTKDFLWGGSTSAYQVEGAAGGGGKGESIWDRFCRKPGTIKDGTNGDVTCNFYQMFRDDISLMKTLNLNAFRFSISWSRILPSGKGKVNQDGIDFYKKMTDRLLSQGIKPVATLYHWDMPQAVEDKGGWRNRDTAFRFSEYTAMVSGLLGERVNMYITLNEPGMFSTLGYILGVHAPGIKDPACFMEMSHTINLAHGHAVSAIRSEASHAAVGLAFQAPPIYPATDTEKDQEAARITDCFINRWWVEPVLLGRYPSELLATIAPLIETDEKDMTVISQPIDFVGLNIYTRLFARHDTSVPKFQAAIDPHYRVKGSRYTENGWEVYPEVMCESILRFKNQWKNPVIYITENGCALNDINKDGEINDSLRIDFYKAYLDNLKQSMHQGAPVKGFFARSLLDGFEWEEGYQKRFGLIHVDFKTLKRTLKYSAIWFKEMIESGGQAR